MAHPEPRSQPLTHDAMIGTSETGLKGLRLVTGMYGHCGRGAAGRPGRRAACGTELDRYGTPDHGVPSSGLSARPCPAVRPSCGSETSMPLEPAFFIHTSHPVALGRGNHRIGALNP
eukprot:765382-Hanusia_phi.AAC.1